MDAPGHQKNGSLDLSNQTLEMTPDLGSCKNVIDLKLDGNNLTTVGRLPDQLEHLSVRNNKIAFVGGMECDTLKTLDYTSNRLISLDGIAKCPQLVELYLGYNYVGDDQIENLTELENLRVLDISHNHLRDRSVLRTIQKLKQLEVLNNSCNEFKLCELGTMSHLRYLMLDSNKLSLFNFKEALPALTHISVRDNKLEWINNLENVPNLAEIYLDGNVINHLRFPKLQQLTVLSLANNTIDTADSLDLPNLETINLSRNKLKSLEFLEKCTNIRTINASRNQLEKMCGMLFNLTSLNISCNTLTDLSQISGFPNLTSLIAGFNDLKNVNEIIQCLKQLSKLESLDLKANPCTAAFYPNIEQIPSNQQMTEFTVKDYDQICPVQDSDVLQIRSQYRGTIISMFSTTLRSFDSFKVSEDEIETVLFLDRSGQLDTLGEISMSMQSPLKTEKSSILASPALLDSNLVSVSQSIDLRGSVSSTRLKFPPEDPNLPSALFPQYNSLATLNTQNSPTPSLTNSLFKYSASPEVNHYIQTSNLNSPDKTEWALDRKAREQRQRTSPLNTKELQKEVREAHNSSIPSIHEFSGTFSKLPMKEIKSKNDPILLQDQLGLSLPADESRGSMVNPMTTPTQMDSGVPTQPHSHREYNIDDQELDLVKKIEEISNKVDKLGDSIQIGRRNESQEFTDTTPFDKDEIFLNTKELGLDTKEIGFNTLTEEFNRMYTDRLSGMKEDLIQRYKAYMSLLRETDTKTPSLNASLDGIQDLAENDEISSALKQAHLRKETQMTDRSNRVKDQMQMTDRSTQTITEDTSKNATTSPFKAKKTKSQSPFKKPPRPKGYTDEFRIKEHPQNSTQNSKRSTDRRHDFDDIDSIVLGNDPPRRLNITTDSPGYGRDARPLREIPALSTRRLEERSNSSFSYTSLRKDFSELNRSNSPAISINRNNSPAMSKYSYHIPEGLNENLKTIITHASIPPRPVMNEEANTPITTEISSHSSEFKIIRDMIQHQGRYNVQKVVKTYTYSKNLEFQSFSINEGDENLDISNCSFFDYEYRNHVMPMFHAATPEVMNQLVSKGFGEVYGEKSSEYLFSRHIDVADRLFYKQNKGMGGRVWRVLLCLVSIGTCETANITLEQFNSKGNPASAQLSNQSLDSLYFPMNQVYLLLKDNRAIPSYLIEYESL